MPRLRSTSLTPRRAGPPVRGPGFQGGSRPFPAAPGDASNANSLAGTTFASLGAKANASLRASRAAEGDGLC